MSLAAAPRRWLLAVRAAGVPRFVNWLVALAFWVVLPSLCALMVIVGTSRVARHLHSFPPGILGTYLVTSHSCSNEICVTSGTFTSRDGRLVETDLLGVYSWEDGETHKAIYNSDSIDVIPLPAHWDPTAIIVGMTGAAGFLVLWSFLLYGAIRRRIVERAERTMRAPPPEPVLA